MSYVIQELALWGSFLRSITVKFAHFVHIFINVRGLDHTIYTIFVYSYYLCLLYRPICLSLTPHILISG